MNSSKSVKPLHQKSFLLCLRTIFLSFFVLCVTTLFSQTVPAKRSTRATDKADGVSIWVNPTEPSKSLIIGANPWKGLATYNLKGEPVEMKNFGGGGAGGVDVRNNFPLGNEKISLVASANNHQNTLRFFKVNPGTLLLEEITGTGVKLNINAYGSCLYHSPHTDKYYMFITSREGYIEQWELTDNGQNKIDAAYRRTINIKTNQDSAANPRTEACVADDRRALLYIAQETECKIWKFGAEPDNTEPGQLADDTRSGEDDNVEGLAIYHAGEQEGYLVASVQGSWKYKVYEGSGSNKYLGSFDIMKADSSGLVEAHDWIAITNMSLGDEFPVGLFVSQNSNNSCGPDYQMVDWNQVAEALSLKINRSRTY